MNHKKAHSQGSIPFSWEDKPGVCKALNNECPLNIGSIQLQALHKKSCSSPSHHLDNSKRIQDIQGKKIPLPPCPLQRPRRTSSGKSFRWQHEDPFLAAYKECTKSDEKNGKQKKGFGSSFSERRSKFVFSCTSINDVRDDSYVKLSHQLPPIPSGVRRNRSFALKADQKQPSVMNHGYDFYGFFS